MKVFFEMVETVRKEAQIQSSQVEDYVCKDLSDMPVINPVAFFCEKSQLQGSIILFFLKKKKSKRLILFRPVYFIVSVHFKFKLLSCFERPPTLQYVHTETHPGEADHLNSKILTRCSGFLKKEHFLLQRKGFYCL